MSFERNWGHICKWAMFANIGIFDNKQESCVHLKWETGDTRHLPKVGVKS